MRDEPRDTFVLAIVRIGFGLLLLNEAWLATEQLRGHGFFGSHFHQPFLPEALVPSRSVYQILLVAQWTVALLIVAGGAVQPAFILAASLLVYTMLCDRLWYHHYRHTMAAFSMLLAFAPCDRHLVLGRPSRPEPASVWAEYAIRAQVSIMYLASGGSKLLDPDWRGGMMMQGMVKGYARLLASRGIAPEFVEVLASPTGSSLLAMGAIATELSLALLLWWSPVRRWALWVGLIFHLQVSLMTPVKLFTAEMLLVYLLFATPDDRARVIRFDPKRHSAQTWIRALDWLRRYRLEPQEGAQFTIVDRDGTELHGVRAAACVFGTMPLTFPLWPVVEGCAVFSGGRKRRAEA
jgi:hypothetical protein